MKLTNFKYSFLLLSSMFLVGSTMKMQAMIMRALVTNNYRYSVGVSNGEVAFSIDPSGKGVIVMPYNELDMYPPTGVHYMIQTLKRVNLYKIRQRGGIEIGEPIQSMNYPANFIIPVTINADGSVSMGEPQTQQQQAPQQPTLQDGRPVIDANIYNALKIPTNASAEEVLGVRKGATREEITQAYKNRTLQWHPERNKSPLANDVFKLINWAKEKLVGK